VVLVPFHSLVLIKDTIEDDMTIPIDTKKTLLINFYKNLTVKGWQFHDNGPNEKDAPLLKQFDCVVAEFMRLKPAYQTVITDVTRRMGHGMTVFIDPTTPIESINDFQLYMHYVAGLVGIGLTDLFVASGLESSTLDRFSLLPTEDEPMTGSNGSEDDISNRMGSLYLTSIYTKDCFFKVSISSKTT